MKYFTFKGISSFDKNITIKKTPPFSKPRLRGEKVSIPGRHGSLFFSEESYDDVIMPIECFVKSDNLAEAARDIKGWLNGEGDLSFSEDPEVFYKAKVVNYFDISYLIRNYGEFVVLMDLEPFSYKLGVQDLMLIEGGTIHNPGTVESQPVITVYGSGNITFNINEKPISLTGISGSITIDSVIQDAYSGETNLNNQMSGDFPVFKVGSNTISWSGSVSYVVIKPNWRYL